MEESPTFLPYGRLDQGFDRSIRPQVFMFCAVAVPPPRPNRSLEMNTLCDNDKDDSTVNSSAGVHRRVNRVLTHLVRDWLLPSSSLASVDAERCHICPPLPGQRDIFILIAFMILLSLSENTFTSCLAMPFILPSGRTGNNFVPGASMAPFHVTALIRLSYFFVSHLQRSIRHPVRVDAAAGSL